MPRKNKKIKKKEALEELADKAISWIGSIESLIVHTLFFVVAFLFGILGVSWNKILLTLTTVVSLEAIYLAIFIQMSVNRNTTSLAEVEEDIDEIQEDVDEINEIEKKEEAIDIAATATMELIKSQMSDLVKSIEELKKAKND